MTWTKVESGKGMAEAPHLRQRRWGGYYGGFGGPFGWRRPFYGGWGMPYGGFGGPFGGPFFGR